VRAVRDPAVRLVILRRKAAWEPLDSWICAQLNCQPAIDDLPAAGFQLVAQGSDAEVWRRP
jgi:hypothetical protein